MRKLFLLLFALLMFVQPVFSANWEQYDKKEYIDSDSIRPNLDISGEIIPYEFTYWTKLLNDGSQYYKGIEQKFNKKVWYKLQQEIINCQKRTLALKSLIIYDTNSQVIFSLEKQFYEIEPISVVPDSVGEFLYNTICEKN